MSNSQENQAFDAFEYVLQDYPYKLRLIIIYAVGDMMDHDVTDFVKALCNGIEALEEHLQQPVLLDREEIRQVKEATDRLMPVWNRPA